MIKRKLKLPPKHSAPLGAPSRVVDSSFWLITCTLLGLTFLAVLWFWMGWP